MGFVDEVTQRLQHDLRTRFPTVAVTVGVDADGDSVLEVAEDRTPWGSVGWDAEDEPSTQAETEAALVHVAEGVGVNPRMRCVCADPGGRSSNMPFIVEGHT